MPDPTEPTAADDGPFEALRAPVVPLAPRSEFADELRTRIAAAVAPPLPDLARSPRAAVPQEEPAMTTALTPYLAVAGADRAIDWYRDVFGAIETMRFAGDDGRIGHAELSIGGAPLFLADEYPEIDVVGPLARGGASVSLHLEVVDVDHSYRRAVAAGASGVREPADQGHGNRSATVVDPFGHRWLLSQEIDADRASQADDTDPGSATWTVTGRAPVEPGYLVLHTGDLGQARAFFGQLFDWVIEDGGAGGGHVANTTFPLGLAPPGVGPASSGSPTTSVYFRVDEIEPYAQRVVDLGGRVLDRQEYPSGTSASCVDDQGYGFDLWKPAPGY